MEKNNFPRSEVRGDEIDLIELWNILWRRKWVIILITAVFAVGSLFYTLILPDRYRSEVLLIPAEEDGGRALMGQLGGLANLAGIDIGGSTGTSQKIRALATLESRAFLAEFINSNNLIIPLMASVPGGQSGVVEIDTEIYDEENQQWVRQVDPPRQPQPSNQEVYEAFTDILTVTDDPGTGLVTIALEWYDPQQIQQWLTGLIRDLNEHMREQDVAEARRAINYLEEQLQRTQLVDMRNVFYNLIEQQTRTIMLADARQGYVFETIDPAVVPEQKSSPNRALICIVGTMLGGVLAILFILVYYAIRSSKQES